MKCTSYRSTILGKDVRYRYDRSTPETSASPGEPVVYFMHGTGFQFLFRSSHETGSNNTHDAYETLVRQSTR